MVSSTVGSTLRDAPRRLAIGPYLHEGEAARGLWPWEAAVAEGPLGIWAALEEFARAEELGLWNHRIMNGH